MRASPPPPLTALPFAVPVVLGAVTALALCLAEDAHADPHAGAGPLRLAPGFTPHPRLSYKLAARVDDTRVHDRGWRQCDPGGGAFTTREPLLTWEVTAPMALRIRLENDVGESAHVGGVIVLPDGSYVCEQQGSQFFMKSWPRGRYALYLYGRSIGVAATVRFEDPTRARADLDAALAALPVVALGGDDVPNPRHQALAPTVAVAVDDAGPTCGKGRQRVMPLARLEVSRAARWYLASERASLFVLTADQRCLDPAQAPLLPAGSHQLWTVVPHDGGLATYPLEIDDRDGLLRFPAAPTREVGALDAPLVIRGQVRPAERWYARRGACGGAACAPDLYLRSDRPLQKASLSLLWSRAPQRLHVMGPLEELGTNSLPRCQDGQRSEHTFDLLEGTYAVWIGGETAAAGSDYHLLVLREGLAIDPMTSLAPIPEELTLADRAVKHHYPYFTGGALTAWTALWTTAPDRLFVYTRAPVADGRTQLPAGEPLLVSWSSRDRTSAIRFDGSHVQVDTRLLALERPARIVLPAQPTLPEVSSLSSAIDKAGPEDARAIAAYKKVDDRYSGCMYRYLSRHDPTWGKNHDVYRIRGDRVVNVGDQVAAAGARACGEKAVTAAGARLEKELARTRAARAARHLAAVRKRFGV